MIKTHEKIDESVQNSKQCTVALRAFKDNVINLSSLSRELDRSTVRGQELIYANINALGTSIKKIDGMKEVAEEIVEAMPKFNVVKEKIRESKSYLYENKAKLAHELSQLTIFMKRIHEPGTIEKLARVMTKVNNIFQSVNEFADELDKRVSSLELVMSKAQMVLSNGKEKISQVDSSYENQQVSLSENEAKVMKKLIQRSNTSIENYEQEIVESLQSIFHVTKKNFHITAEMKNNLEQGNEV